MAAINRAWILYRMAFIWGILISLSSLGTCIVAALQNAQWSMLNSQARFLLVVMIFINWSAAMTALITNTAKKIESGKLPFDSGNTEQFVKNETTFSKTTGLVSST